MVQQGSDTGWCHKSNYWDSLNTVIIESKEISFFGGTVDLTVDRNKLSSPQEDC